MRVSSQVEPVAGAEPVAGVEPVAGAEPPRRPAELKRKVEISLEVTDGVIQARTMYELLGGAETIGRLVDSFYSRVAVDPDLSPIFPRDLSMTREKQFRFLTQLTGGPPLHAELYGPPRLRARHLRFPITPRRAEAWLNCMSRAMDDIGLEGPVREHFFERLRRVAHNMVNTEDEHGETTFV